MAEDYYALLKIRRDATQDEIKRAYRGLARKWHPDVNPDPATQEKFKEITLAYYVLSDTEKRRMYDLGVDPFERRGGGGTAAGPGFDGAGRRFMAESSGSGTVGPLIGQRMPDGTIYAGISPSNGMPLYAAPADAGVRMSFRKAARWARKLQVGDKNDFRVPTKAELKMLYKLRNTGAFIGTFRTESEGKAGWYWSCKSSFFLAASCRRFYSGLPFPALKFSRASVRCVRSDM